MIILIILVKYVIHPVKHALMVLMLHVLLVKKELIFITNNAF